VALLVRGDRLGRSLAEILEGLDLHPVRIGGVEELDALVGADDGVRLVLADSESLGSGDLPGLAEIRRRPEMKAIPVIVFSRTERLGDDAICREYGVNTVLRRPVAPSALLQALDRELHPRLDVLVLATNPFLRTMVSGILLARGHGVRFEEPLENILSAEPDVCILDGESPGFSVQWGEVAKRHPDALRIQLGGEQATPTALRLSRHLTAEEINDVVERAGAGRRRSQEG
jgi:CheY-like chemotaxis protein